MLTRAAIILALSIPLPACATLDRQHVAKASDLASRVCQVLNAAAVWTRLPTESDPGKFELNGAQFDAADYKTAYENRSAE